MPKKPFWQWVFCESDGTPSSSRVLTAVALAFALGWVTAIVKWTHGLPDFAGLIAFISALYGINSIKSAFQGKQGNQQ